MTPRSVLRRIGAPLAAVLLALSGPVTAQPAWPAQPIRIVVPFAPGGITDVIARLVGKSLSDQVGQPVVIENKPGGGAIVATETVARAKPDGYTLGIVLAQVATNPGLYPRLPYDAQKDLAPVITVLAQGFVIAVGEKQPYRTLAELFEAARKPGAEIPFASPGTGTLMHLTGPRANAEYGTQFVHVPYKGSVPALQDAVSGQVPMIIDPASTAAPFVRQGRLRALAVTHPTRLPFLPDVPTVRELGYPALEAVGFQGVVAPAGTPPAVIAQLNAALNRALASAEVRERIEGQMGQTLIGGTPEAFGEMIRVETERWSPLIRRLGLKPE
jgi:tripartite-type tricarboxylate transporter receptor subunit TctC